MPDGPDLTLIGRLVGALVGVCLLAVIATAVLVLTTHVVGWLLSAL